MIQRIVSFFLFLFFLIFFFLFFFWYLQPSDTLQGLIDWKEVFHQSAPFNVKYFQAFLPEDTPAVGTPYTLIETNLNRFTNQLSSNRFYPPVVHGNRGNFIHKLLSMFHPRPFINSRFGPQGSVAVVRAESDKYLDIVFRWDFTS